jgi:hypothetical protein
MQALVCEQGAALLAGMRAFMWSYHWRVTQQGGCMALTLCMAGMRTRQVNKLCHMQVEAMTSFRQSQV